MKRLNTLFSKMKKDINKIPNGYYCLDSRGRCPYWSIREDMPEYNNGYCSYIEKGDWELGDKSMLWNECKECGIRENNSFVELWDYISRKDIQSHKDTVFLFGDNLKRIGLGGQAKEMRGEPNTVGIVAKKSPSNSPDAFFTDEDFEFVKEIIDEDFEKVWECIGKGMSVVIPRSGIGTGLARLEEKSPLIFQYIKSKIEELL